MEWQFAGRLLMTAGHKWRAGLVKIRKLGLNFCELFNYLELIPQLKTENAQMTSRFGLVLTLLLLFLLPPGVALADDTPFPRPAELEPDVQFWLSVFTGHSTDEGLLHDNRRLAVVYETMPMPAATSRRERNRKVQQRREYYQKILRSLAGGKRDNLTAEEQRVLALWPADITNAELQAAGSRIRFQQGLSDRFRDGLIRAGRWRDHVQKEFARLGVPRELAALPHVESSYNPDARSHVGASGIWQFTRSTGRRFMQVDHVIDERNDPFLATRAAGRLLAYNYSIVGNWPMAITAYNHGLAGVRRAMRKYGDTAVVDILRNYNGRTFGFASRNFYVAFLAAMEVDRNVDRYFPGLVPDRPVAYSTATLPDFMPAAAVAAALGISERELARHNTGLQATIWQGSKYLPKNLEIRVPTYLLSAPIAELIATVPPAERHPSQLPDLYHTIVRGDTLSALAAEYGTSVRTLVALNNLGSSNRIRAGQKLRLPAAGPAPVVVAATSPPGVSSVIPEPELAAELPAGAMASAPAIAAIADRPVADTVAISDERAPIDAGIITDEGIPPDELAPPEEEPAQASLLSDPSDYSVDENSTIEVQPLETLGHYADWLGVRTQRIRDINGLAFRTPVEVGQRIKLDLSKVDAQAFENLRTAWHRDQQDAFFRTHRISGITEHTVGPGESVWILSLRKYGVPIWLFRQYNPELDVQNVRPGAILRFPLLVESDSS
jgi:membrane-bound lytic murein transglycosylase D